MFIKIYAIVKREIKSKKEKKNLNGFNEPFKIIASLTMHFKISEFHSIIFRVI